MEEVKIRRVEVKEKKKEQGQRKEEEEILKGCGWTLFPPPLNIQQLESETTWK